MAKAKQKPPPELDLPTFRMDGILQAHTDRIKMRLHRMELPGGGVMYWVYAFPENAKQKSSRGGATVETWPEALLGAMEETGKTFENAKEWRIYPVNANYQGIYKSAVATVVGREPAAIALLEWIVKRNQNKRRRPVTKKARARA